MKRIILILLLTCFVTPLAYAGIISSKPAEFILSTLLSNNNNAQQPEYDSKKLSPMDVLPDDVVKLMINDYLISDLSTLAQVNKRLKRLSELVQKDISDDDNEIIQKYDQKIAELKEEYKEYKKEYEKNKSWGVFLGLRESAKYRPSLWDNEETNKWNLERSLQGMLDCFYKFVTERKEINPKAAHLIMNKFARAGAIINAQELDVFIKKSQRPDNLSTELLCGNSIMRYSFGFDHENKVATNALIGIGTTACSKRINPLMYLLFAEFISDLRIWDKCKEYKEVEWIVDAIQYGHADTIENNIDKINDLSFRYLFDSLYIQLLFLAIRRNHLTAVISLIDMNEKGSNIDINNPDVDFNFTALELASALGRTEIVTWLLARGANPNRRGWLKTALECAEMFDHTQVIELLEDAQDERSEKNNNNNNQEHEYNEWH